jgi:type II secretory pathway pseudopilin PulG
LIELMVTVTIMMLLAAAAAPFALSWGDQSAVRQSQTLLQQGMNLLKATALRNPSAATGTASAVLVSIPGQLCVSSGLPLALDCSGALWTSKPPASIKLNGATSQCIALASTALPLAAAIGGTNCSSSLGFSISRGSEVSNGTLN